MECGLLERKANQPSNFGISASGEQVLQRIESMFCVMNVMHSSGKDSICSMNLALKIVDNTPNDDFSQITLDTRCKRGELLLAKIYRLVQNGCDVEKAVKSVMGIDYLKSNVEHAIINIERATGFRPNIILLEIEKIISGDFLNMEFDNVLANPPYDGTSSMHQKFFNIAISKLVKDDGNVVFIQPDTAYTSKKKNQKPDNVEMQNHIRRYKTYVEFVPGAVFDNATISTGLSITHMQKTESDKISVKYMNGNEYEHIELDNINKMGVSPDIYNSVIRKVENYIERNGSLGDITRFKPGNHYRLSKIVGNTGKNGPKDDFYTIVSKDKKSHMIQNCDFGLEISKGQEDSVYSFLTLFITRFCLSVLKINKNNHRNEFDFIPLVPFDRIWTDEMLQAELNITDNELNVITSYIPDYYGKASNVK
jgi:hypothetical protein